MNLRWSTAAVLALLGLTLAARALTLSRDRPFPIYDEATYLGMARDFREAGGAFAAVGAYWRGAYREDGKNPLYALLIAPLMDGTQADYARAKLASLACALLLAAAVFYLSRGLWGEDAALLAAALICLSPATAFLARESLGDPLFAAAYCGALLILAGAGKSLRAWALFGVGAGLAYLAKPNGHLLFVSAAAAGFATFGRRFPRGPHLYAAMTCFALVCAFLLMRNMRLGGSPFYYYYGKALWMDQFRYSHVWRGRPEWEALGLRSYLAAHSWAQVAERLRAGFFGFPPLFAQTMGVGPEADPWRTVSGALLSGLALRGARDRWRAGKRAEVAALTATGALLDAALAWMFYLDHGTMRYAYPIAASWAPLAAVGACGPASARWGRSWPAALRAGIACACLPILAGSTAGLRGNPLAYCGVSAHWRQTSEWIKANAGSGGVLIDSRSLYTAWDSGLEVNRPYFFDEPDADILDYAARSGARFALLDRHVNGLDPSRGKYGPLDEHGPVSFLGWPRCFHDAQSPSVFLIYSSRCPRADR